MKQDISIVRCRTHTFDISVTDTDGDPYVLQSGEKMIFGVKKTYSDNDYVLTKEITSADATATAGVYSVTINPNDTNNIKCGEYCYDIGLKSGQNYYSVVECSHLKIEHNVTKMGAG